MESDLLIGAVGMKRCNNEGKDGPLYVLRSKRPGAFAPTHEKKTSPSILG